jgi:hypothetical protein
MRRLPPSRFSGSQHGDGALPVRIEQLLLGIDLISQAKTGISALALNRDLGVSHPTDRLGHKTINRAIGGQETAYLLDRTVQLNDAYLGGNCCGGKKGRGAEKTVAFVAAP